MEATYTIIYVINISKVFKGFGDIKNKVMEHSPWLWGDNARTLVTPLDFKNYFESVYFELDIEASDNYGGWQVIRDRLNQLCYDDRRPRDGDQNEHFIDLEN